MVITTSDKPTNDLSIWWSNAAFFVLVHLASLIGVFYHPIWYTSRYTLLLTFFLFQTSCFGITIGYHRYFTHRSFKAGFGIKAALALIGSGAVQGSIKWWALRHRLHHRWTDDPVHDPYSATHGLLWSHMGWIFFKSNYERMHLIEKGDLENDPVVQFQHRHYAPLALFTGFILPVILGSFWRDARGALVWASLVKVVMVWHCTFMINSLAHWGGLQPYSDQDTSRTNFLIALLTCGEGNHNFHHAFPYDFRSSPEPLDWDPSKWIIMLLHRGGFVKDLRRVRDKDIDAAVHDILVKADSDPQSFVEQTGLWLVNLPLWTVAQVRTYAASRPGRCVLILGDVVVDATSYLVEHPGGARILRKYSLRHRPKGADSLGNAEASEAEASERWREATDAFGGGLNTHTYGAQRQMREFVVAKLLHDDQ